MNTNDYSLSIVVPYRNRAATLLRCLNSLVAQVVMPNYIIMVDNGSTDNSHQLVDTFIHQANTPSTTWLHHTELRPGASAARNAGLALVVTPYVCFFDSDDVFSPNFVAEALALFKQQPYDMVLCPTAMLFPNGKRCIRPLKVPLTLDKHLVYSVINTQCFVVRTAFLKAVGAWNNELPLWNDYELGARLLAARPTLGYMQHTHHTLYQHEDSITGQSRHTPLQAYFDVFLRLEANNISLSSTSEQQQHTFALAVKMSHWQGRMLRQQRHISLLKGFSNWSKQLLDRLPRRQRFYCHFVRCGTAHGIPALLQLWPLFRI